MNTHYMNTDTMTFASLQSLIIDESGSPKAVKVNGNAGADEIYGSDYNDVLNGNAGNDQIWGGFGNDTINGGLGNDRLYGEDGKDSFLFNTKLGKSNIDHIGDFRTADDSVKLDNAIFKWAGQKTGGIKSSEFKVIGDGQKQDANDHILYNHDKGALYYDVDGAGGVKPVMFAVVDNFSGDVPTMTYHDFLIV